MKTAKEYHDDIEAHPLKPAEQPQRELLEALTPLVDGRRLIAVKVYYLSTTDGVTLDVGVQCIAKNSAALAALATVVRDDAELGSLPHAEQYSTSFIEKQPVRH